MNADTATIGEVLEYARSKSSDANTEDATPDEARGTREPRSLAAALLEAPDSASWGALLARLGVGLGLAAVFGGCLGLRLGGGAIPAHALGALLGLAAVAGVAAPSFAIIVALVDVPMDAHALARATSGAIARAGLMLGGLAPAAALYVTTVEDAITVSIVALGALALAGAVGVASFTKDLGVPLAVASAETRRWMKVAMPLFLTFATLLALRVWWLALPVLPGGFR